MRITFFSNFFNAHQLPLALEFCAMKGVEYTFVSLLAVNDMVGRTNLDDDYAFVVKEYEGGEGRALAMRHALVDDVVVFGDMAGKERYVRAREKTGKLFFRYAERLLKRGDWWRFVPPKVFRTWDMFCRYKNSNMFVLCASAYTARDLSLFGFPSDKCLKWGYFPTIACADKRVEAREMNGIVKLCSAQRLIGWKQVDLQVLLASALKSRGISFTLEIAGDGTERSKLEHMVDALGLRENITFLGEIERDDVQLLMQKSDIFLATSNRKEGWGATINEAMAAGCCVIASDALGSVPYLIKDGVNGFSFPDGELSSLSDKCLRAISDNTLCRKLGTAASDEIAHVWNAETAAKRLVSFSTHHGENDISAPSEGPLSAGME